MKKILTLFAIAMVAMTATADKVSVDGARQKAAEFINQQMTKSGAKKVTAKNNKLTLAYKADSEAFYVFNISNGGYVISAGDDCACPVLGYTTSGTFSYDNAPEALKGILAQYEQEIASASKKGMKYNEESVIRHEAIDTMLTTKWNQLNPYYILCPTATTIFGTKVNCPTGCVITAAAQVLKYNKWPEHGYGIAVNTKTYKSPDSLDISDHYFNYDAMLDRYDESTSAEADTLIASFMHDLGYVFNAKYTATDTGVTTEYIAYGLVQNLGYDKGAHMEISDWYNAEDWDSIIYCELSQHRPVIFGGCVPKSNAGHCFVLDGCDDNGYYHVNWGWGGLSDGYFRLKALTPSAVGTGASFNANGFNGRQLAVIGLQKECGGESTTIIAQEKNLLFQKKDGHLYLIPCIICCSNCKHDKFGLIAKITNKQTGNVTYFPLTFDETVIPGKEDQNCYKAIDMDSFNIADGDYTLELRYRIGYDNDAAIEESQLYEPRHNLSANTYLDLSVADGVKKFSVPEDAKPEYSVAFTSTLRLGASIDGEDYTFDANVTNDGFPVELPLVAHMGYIDENDEFHSLYTSDTVNTIMQYGETKTESFTFHELSYDEICSHENVMVTIDGTDGTVYKTTTVKVNPRLFYVEEPVMVNQVHDGEIDVNDINGDITASGVLKAAQDFNVYGMMLMLYDTNSTEWSIENKAAIEFKPSNTSFVEGETLDLADIQATHTDTPFETGMTVTVEFNCLADFNHSWVNDDVIKMQYITVVGTPDGIKEVNANNKGVKKVVRNGNIIIVKGGNEYTTAGQLIK